MRFSLKIVIFISCILFCLLFNWYGNSCIAQSKGEGRLEDDTVESGAPLRKKDLRPRRATIMSALVPGLGQAYNKKYWKLPILYAIGGVLVYFVRFNNQYYKAFSKAYNDTTYSVEHSLQTLVWGTSAGSIYPNLGQYSPTNLKTLRDYYRRDRDLSIIGLVGIYLINVVDAHVDAHLRTFNINDNLTMEINPKISPGLFGSFAPGICLNVKFRK